LKSATAPAGSAIGKLSFTVDRDNPGRTTAVGALKGEALDLAWAIGRPVSIERISLDADGSSLRIGEAAVNWAGQRATLQGEVRYGASGPVIDARIDSPGVILDALLTPKGKTAGDEPPAADGKDAASRLWPLPVTGRIAVRSDFVQRGRYKVAPVVATLVLEEQRAHMDLKQAQLCGISLPLTIEVTPNGYAASARITAQKQQLEQTAHCLTDQRVLITGDFDLKADISTHGRLAERTRNLKGTLSMEARDGRVMKFAVLGNILSVQNIDALLKQDGPKLDEQGFPYRKLAVAGRFENGRFLVDESAFHSNAVGLAGTGWVSLLDYSSRLTVLVAPFSRVDQLVRKVPLVGYIVGGTFTSVPVGVSGDIRDPVVVPLGPRAVTSQLVGIFERTLKLPVKLITPAEIK
ncbi:MAG: AsmA-like C-terminal domain-containing protein, partial [Terriglobales bacterium]